MASRRPGPDVSGIQTTDARSREAAATIPVYGQLPFVPASTSGCDIITDDGERILDLYGGHAVAALGYGHPALVAAIKHQSESLLFQSNAVALEVRARAAERLVEVGAEGPGSRVLRQLRRRGQRERTAHGLQPHDGPRQGTGSYWRFSRPYGGRRCRDLEFGQMVRLPAASLSMSTSYRETIAKRHDV